MCKLHGLAGNIYGRFHINIYYTLHEAFIVVKYVFSEAMSVDIKASVDTPRITKSATKNVRRKWSIKYK